MAGIQIEQLDFDSLQKYFPSKKDLKDYFEQAELDIESATARDALIDKLKTLSKEELAELGIEGRLEDFITKSDDVNEITDVIDVTESDGVDYHIEPTRGYVAKDGVNLLVYQHPLKHNANEVEETTDKKFASADEKSTWNAKVGQNQLDNSVKGLKSDLSSMILTYVNNLEQRLNAVEALLDISTLENKRKELVNIINNSLDAICKNFSILGNNVTKSFNIEHKLNSKDIQVFVIDNDTMSFVYPQINIINYNNITVDFSKAPLSTENYTVVISGKKEIDTVYSEVNALLSSLLNKMTIVGDGTTKEYTLRHELGTKDLYISCDLVGSEADVPAYPDIFVSNDDFVTVKFKKAPISGTTYNFYFSKTPVLTNQYDNEVLASLTTDPRCKGFNNVNYVCSRAIKSYNISLDAGETEFTLSHNNNTQYIQVGLYDKSTLEYTLFPDYTIIDDNRIKLKFSPSDIPRNFRATLLSHEEIVYQTLDDPDVAVSYVALDTTSAHIYGEGNTLQLTATVIPEDATNKNVTWSSDNNAVATVDSNGLVTLVSPTGSCNITVTTVDGNHTASCNIIARPAIVPVDSISLNMNEIDFSNLDYTETLEATVSPVDATFPDYVWETSNESIATVDENGVVTPISEGACLITATSTSDPTKSATCNVRIEIRRVPATGIYVNPDSCSLRVGETQKIDYHLLPANVTDKTVNITSANPEIARINTLNRLIVAVDVGITKVTVEAHDGSGVKKTIHVSVYEDPEPEPGE